jgi:hypothetical protein
VNGHGKQALRFPNAALSLFLAGMPTIDGGPGNHQMSDVLFVLATTLFFVLGIAYVLGCERLRSEK